MTEYGTLNITATYGKKDNYYFIIKISAGASFFIIKRDNFNIDLLIKGDIIKVW